MAYLIKSYSETNQDSFSNIRNGSNHYYGQSFMNSNANILDSCKFYIRKFGSPTGNVYAYIYAHSGTFGTNGVPTGSALAISDALDISTLKTTVSLKTFSFSGANRINLLASTPYCLLIDFTEGNSSNILQAGYDTTSPTSPGNMINYTFSWQHYTTYAFCFYVYGENPVDATSNIKSINSLLYASISNKNGITMASVKSINGLV